MNKFRRGEGKLKSFDSKSGCVPQCQNMANEEARWEEERNYHKIFFTMAEKVDKLFAEEKTFKPKNKEPVDHASVNPEGEGEEPPPSPSSDSFDRCNRDSRHTSKKPFLKLDVKFDLAMYAKECNVENTNNWIKYIEFYCQI